MSYTKAELDNFLQCTQCCLGDKTYNYVVLRRNGRDDEAKCLFNEILWLTGVLKTLRAFHPIGTVISPAVAEQHFGKIEKSSNAATSWVVKSSKTKLINDVDVNNYPLSSSVGNMYAAGEGGIILVSTDGGDTWVEKSSGLPDDLYFISATNNFDIVFAAGDNTSFISQSSDAGVNWSNFFVGAPEKMRGGWELPSLTNNTYLVGLNGMIWWTSNAGVNWSLAPSGTTQTLNKVIFTPDDSVGIIVGDAGIILRTTDKTNWIIVTSPTTFKLNSIFFIDNSIAIIVGNKSVLRTIDGGANWTAIDISLISADFILNGVTCNGTRLIASGFNNITQKIFTVESVDIGLTWTEKTHYPIQTQDYIISDVACRTGTNNFITSLNKVIAAQSAVIQPTVDCFDQKVADDNIQKIKQLCDCMCNDIQDIERASIPATQCPEEEATGTGTFCDQLNGCPTIKNFNERITVLEKSGGGGGGITDVQLQNQVWIDKLGEDGTALINSIVKKFKTADGAITKALLHGGAMVFHAGVGTFDHTLNLGSADNWSWDLTDETTMNGTLGNQIDNVSGFKNFSLRGGHLTTTVAGAKNLNIDTVSNASITFRPISNSSDNGDSIIVTGITNSNIDIDTNSFSVANIAIKTVAIDDVSLVRIRGYFHSVDGVACDISKNTDWEGKAYSANARDLIIRSAVCYGIAANNGMECVGANSFFEGVAKNVLITGESSQVILTSSNDAVKVIVENRGFSNCIDLGGSLATLISNQVGVAATLSVKNYASTYLDITMILGTIVLENTSNVAGGVGSNTITMIGGELIVKDFLWLGDQIVVNRGCKLTIASSGKLIQLNTSQSTPCVLINGGDFEADGARFVPFQTTAFGVNFNTLQDYKVYEKSFSKGISGGEGDWTIDQKKKIKFHVTSDFTDTKIISLDDGTNPPQTPTASGTGRTKIQLAGDMKILIDTSGLNFMTINNGDGTFTVETTTAGIEFLWASFVNIDDPAEILRRNNKTPFNLIPTTIPNGSGIVINANVTV